MKKLSIALFLTAAICAGCSHHRHETRKIEVSGTAEKEITPDIINVTVSLKEYKNGGTKVNISTLEGQLEKAVAEAGIAKTDFTISDLSSFSEDYWLQRKKKGDFLVSKTYNIHFHDLTKFDEIISKVDAKGIESTEVAGYDYSKLTDEKRKLKIEALKAAKTKAKYLLDTFDEKLGKVISISDGSDGYPDLASQFKENYSVSGNNGYSSSRISAKKMKLQFQMNAVFEIAD